MRFKLWLENDNLNREKEIERIWQATFKALGINGLGDNDAMNQSLSKLQMNQQGSSSSDTFKGKRAAEKLLDNGQIFKRLTDLQDPDLNQTIEDTKRWLGQNDDHGPNASTTVGGLLQKLFGDKYYGRLSDIDVPPESPKPQVPPQPPKNNLGPMGPAPGQGPEQGQQPPMQPPQPPQTPMQPNPDMPQPPPGAKQGLY